MKTERRYADRITEAGVDRTAIAGTTVRVQVGDVPAEGILRHPVAPLCRGLAALGFRAIHVCGAIEYLDGLAAYVRGAPLVQEPGAWLDEELLEQASPADIIVDLTNDRQLALLCARLSEARGGRLITLTYRRTWVGLRCWPPSWPTLPGQDTPDAPAPEPCLPLSRIVAGLALQEAVLYAGHVNQAVPADADVVYNVASDSRTGFTSNEAWSDVGIENATIELVGAGALGCTFLDAFAPLLHQRCELRIFDRDVVGPENLALQLLYTPEDVGRPKAIVAAERLSELCQCSVTVQPFVMKYQERPRRLSLPTLRVCAVDNFAARLFANELSVIERVPFLDAGSSPLAGRQATFYPGRTSCLRCRIPNLASLAAAEQGSASCSHLGAPTLSGTNMIIGAILGSEALRALNPATYGWPAHGTIAYDARFPQRFGVIDDRPPCRHARTNESQHERTGPRPR